MHKTLLLLFFFYCLNGISQTEPKVLIIGIDGCRPDALTLANTPNLDALIANGISSMDALNDDITISGPGWSAMLTGVWSAKHGVTDNSFAGSNYDQYPHFFKYLEAFNPDFHTVSFCHWGPINDFIVLDHADFKQNVSTDQAVADQAVAYLTVNNPDALFLHFDDVDHAGHSSGFSPDVPAYISAIESVDVHVGAVMAAVHSRPNYAQEKWLILVSTDHGGKGFGHGGTSMEEENIFVIASGDHLPTEVIRKDSMTTIIPLPENCLDTPVELVFDGNNDQVHVPANDLFDFGSDQDFTIECRVRTNQAGDVNIVGNKDWNSGLNPGFVLSFKYPAGPEWKVNIGDGSNRADINTGGQIADGEWHTLSVSFDRDGYMVMYEDGVFVDSTDISFIGDIDIGEGLFFGNDLTGGYAYQGSLAEVRIWKKVLSATAIQDWHCTSLGESHPGYDQLIGYWKADEGAGATQLTDSSPFQNFGTITEAQWALPDTIAIIEDYSATPRTPDIAVSALTHLCVPIDAAWELDGQSLVPVCETTATSEVENPDAVFQLSPVPVSDHLQVEIIQPIQGRYTLCLFSNTGQKLNCWTNNQQALTLDISYPAGVYSLQLELNDKVYSQKIVIKK
ncbi:MAG: hypothetical protein DHS20C18_07920 [Saprospiraceae bacterium]|nr:MAG: hypothetical protein DHS20C18_07920 [Saprospiraceae bacterium]